MTVALVSTLPLSSQRWCFPCPVSNTIDRRNEDPCITILAEGCCRTAGCEAVQPWLFPCLVAWSTCTCGVLLISPPLKSGRDSSAHTGGSSSPLEASSGVRNTVCMHQSDRDHGLSSKREVSLVAVRPRPMPCQVAPMVCSSRSPAWCCTYCIGTLACTVTSQSYLTRCYTVWQSCTLCHAVLKERWVFAVK